MYVSNMCFYRKCGRKITNERSVRGKTKENKRIRSNNGLIKREVFIHAKRIITAPHFFSYARIIVWPLSHKPNTTKSEIEWSVGLKWGETGGMAT